MAESNQKHMKPSWATGQTVSIREESIIYNGSYLGGQFSCVLLSFLLSRSLSFISLHEVFMLFVIRIITVTMVHNVCNSLNICFYEEM